MKESEIKISTIPQLSHVIDRIDSKSPEYLKVNEVKVQYQEIHKITCFLCINETE